MDRLDLATKRSHRRRRCEHGTDVVLLKDAVIRTRIWSSNWLTLQNTETTCLDVNNAYAGVLLPNKTK